MKFGKTIEHHKTHEWREMYVDYNELKRQIILNVANAPKDANRADYFKNFELQFFYTCDEELSRVNNFYAQKMAEARRKNATLKIRLLSLFKDMRQGSVDSVGSTGSIYVVSSSHGKQILRQLSFSYTEFYYSLILLQNYQALNMTAFYKICKKYDKNMQSSEGADWYNRNVDRAEFSREGPLLHIINEVESLYTTYLAGGDRSKAMLKLRVPTLRDSTPNKYVFLAGIVMGFFAVAAMVILLTIIFRYNEVEFLSAFTHIHRFFFTASYFCFLIYLNVHFWQLVGVNHVLILELDPRHHLHAIKHLCIASIFGFLCTLSMIGYLYYDLVWNLPTPYYCPLVFLGISFALFFNPIPIMFHKSRLWLIRAIGRTLATPIFRVTFADFYIGEQMYSLVICFVDFYYLMRFYVRYWKNSELAFDFEPDYVVPFIRCLPAWIRVAQCIRRYGDKEIRMVRFVANTTKHSTIFLVVLFSTLKVATSENYDTIFANPYMWCYIISSTISSVYFLAWDLLRDFGLFKVWSGQHLFLRDELFYRQSFYYFVIVENTLIRFFWILELYLVTNNLLLPYNCKTLGSILELTRRFFWNCLRLDHEHFYNVGNFRATRDILIGPISSKEQLLIERLMDQSDTISVSSIQTKSYRTKWDKKYT